MGEIWHDHHQHLESEDEGDHTASEKKPDADEDGHLSCGRAAHDPGDSGQTSGTAVCDRGIL